MAWDDVPTTFLGAGYTADASNMTLVLANFPEITAAEADEATGDSRKIIYGLCEKFWSAWNGLAVADRPTKMTLTKSSSVDVTTGVVTNVFTFSFKNSITAQDVAAEQ